MAELAQKAAIVTRRQVIYRSALPPPPSSASDVYRGIRVLRILVALGPIGAALYFLGVWIAAGFVLVIGLLAVWLWQRARNAPRRYFPDFVALTDQGIEIAGPGITRDFEPAKRLPLAEISDWRVHRKDDRPYGDIDGAAFTHGKDSYILRIDTADLLDLTVLSEIAPKVAGELGGRTAHNATP